MSNPQLHNFLPDIEGESRRLRIRSGILMNHDYVTDIELTEAVLFTVVKRRDVGPLARMLINRYGSFASAISAPILSLRAQPGMTDASVAALRSVLIAAKRLAKEEFLFGKKLGDWRKLSTYLLVELSKEKTEKIIALYLDKRRKILANEVHASGDGKNVGLEMRKLAGLALQLNATSLILAHNHPSGDTKPSLDDIQTTEDIQATLEALGIELLDHIIIGNGSCLSIRKGILIY